MEMRVNRLTIDPPKCMLSMMPGTCSDYSTCCEVASGFEALILEGVFREQRTAITAPYDIEVAVVTGALPDGYRESTLIELLTFRLDFRRPGINMRVIAGNAGWFNGHRGTRFAQIEYKNNMWTIGLSSPALMDSRSIKTYAQLRLVVAAL